MDMLLTIAIDKSERLTIS